MTPTPGGLAAPESPRARRFTSQSSQRLFQEAFPSRNVTVQAYGNVLTAVASLHGLSSEELTRAELEFNDPDYEVLIAIRAVK